MWRRCTYNIVDGLSMAVTMAMAVANMDWLSWSYNWAMEVGK
jgi:hypothetical protein